MEKLTFKTNINCSNCVRAVTGFLDGVPGVSTWKVETENPNKTLRVTGTVTKEQIMEAVLDAGFDIEPIPNETMNNTP